MARIHSDQELSIKTAFACFEKIATSKRATAEVTASIRSDGLHVIVIAV